MFMYVQLLCSSKNDRNNLTETDLIYSDKRTVENTIRQSSVLEVSVSGHGGPNPFTHFTSVSIKNKF